MHCCTLFKCNNRKCIVIVLRNVTEWINKLYAFLSTKLSCFLFLIKKYTSCRAVYIVQFLKVWNILHITFQSNFELFFVKNNSIINLFLFHPYHFLSTCNTLLLSNIIKFYIYFISLLNSCVIWKLTFKVLFTTRYIRRIWNNRGRVWYGYVIHYLGICQMHGSFQLWYLRVSLIIIPWPFHTCPWIFCILKSTILISHYSLKLTD